MSYRFLTQASGSRPRWHQWDRPGHDPMGEAALGVLPALIGGGVVVIGEAVIWESIDYSQQVVAEEEEMERRGAGCSIPPICEAAMARAPEYFNTAIAQQYCRWPIGAERGKVVSICEDALFRKAADIKQAAPPTTTTSPPPSTPPPTTAPPPRKSGTSTSTSVAALQAQANQILSARGCVPVTTDGILGPKTCGAVREAGLTPPAGCTSFTPPVCTGARTTSGMSGATMAGIGLAVAGVATAGFLLFKRRR